LHLRQFEPECIDDVILLGFGLACPEKQRLREVILKRITPNAALLARKRFRIRFEAALIWRRFVWRISID